MGRLACCILAAAAVVALLSSPAAEARGSSGVAALQVALRAKGFYGGTVDGYLGPRTRRAVVRLQRRRGLIVDGIPGRQTRRALGRRGRPGYGRRAIRRGAFGWDVAAMQFLLAWQGFPSGPMDGGFGGRTERALRRFQARAGLLADGVAGPLTLRALGRRPVPRSPVRLLRPVRGQPLGDRYGPRGDRFHAGLDLPAPRGWNVRAAGFGRVRFTGWLPGWGNTVTLRHRFGLRTLYAHLSRITVRRGERVAAGERIGLVGSSGAATGPHLHFEVILRGANVNPLSAGLG